MLNKLKLLALSFLALEKYNLINTGKPKRSQTPPQRFQRPKSQRKKRK